MNTVNVFDYVSSKSTGLNSKEIGDTLYGFNHSEPMALLPTNKDKNGIIFFTKPQLNLTDMNIINLPALVSRDEMSISRFVRTTLDPRLQFDYDNDITNQKKITCPLVDKHNPFIPVLSNTLESLSGWPDVTVPTYTSTPGLRKEQYTMVDGIYEIYDAYDLTATFKNFVNEPLSLLFETWSKVPAYVHEGLMNDYMGLMLANEFSYNTRIYRFIMDKSNRFITKVACTGASFPNSNPTGNSFDYDRKNSYTGQNKSININFKCMGAIYNDDRTLLDFNKITASFNNEVYNLLMGRDHNLFKIPYEILPMFKGRGIPIIDLDTRELLWYIDNDSPTLKRVINEIEMNEEK